MLKIKRLLPLLFSLVLLFCSALPVQAAEFESYTVSGGDLVPQSDFGIALMNEDYGISTVASVYPYAIPSGLKTITYWPSYTTSHEVLEISLFKFVLTDYVPESVWQNYNAMRLYGSINIQNIVGMNPYMARLWVRHDGNKYELVNERNWYGFQANEKFLTPDFEVGIDIYFNNRFRSDPDRPLSEYSRPDLYEDNLTVVWEAFSFDVMFKNTISGEKLDNIETRLELNNWYVTEKLNEVISNIQTYGQMIVSNIQFYCGEIITTLSEKFNELICNISDFRTEALNYYNGMISKLSSWFTTLFEKMDEDQEELINGYDPGTGSAAKNEFDSSAAELEAAEGDLFGQTSYDQVDYTQFNSFFSIEAVAASMLFVKSILESLYGALGVFGVPITIGLVLLVFTRIIGFQNFYSGGD